MKDEILNAIEKSNTIIIHRHVRPDPDALGSQAGLKEILKSSYPEKHIMMTGEDEPTLTFLAEMEEVTGHQYSNALVIVCDTANTDRIDDSRYKTGNSLIKIDHHPEVDSYGDIQWVDPSASSTSEMIYSLYLHGKEKGLQMNVNAARLLYAGIVGDTGRFMFPNTTQLTMTYASDLIAYDFDRQQLFDGLYQIKPEIAKLKGYILQNYVLDKSGLSTIRLTQDIMDEFGLDPSQTSQTVGTLGELEGVIVWVMFVEEKNQIRARLRSKGPSINHIAAAFHGGGHPLASGATVYSWEEADKLCSELEAVCQVYMKK